LLFIFFILSSTSFLRSYTIRFVAQGAKVSTASGLVVSQSIGQQSMAGSSKNGVTVQQGFQQYAISKIVLVVPDDKGLQRSCILILCE
jgi:hypothetical protein